VEHSVSSLLTHEGSDYVVDPTEQVLTALPPYTRALIGHLTISVSGLYRAEWHDL
jgi:hypothetical protein